MKVTKLRQCNQLILGNTLLVKDVNTGQKKKKSRGERKGGKKERSKPKNLLKSEKSYC